jgi:hypothetical protein
MKSLSVIMTLTIWVVFAVPAEAINITLAEVQNGVAVVQGNKAAKDTVITWETSAVGQTSKGGSFSFSGVAPADCIATLTIGTETIDVALDHCAAPAPVPQTGQTTSYAAGDDGAIKAGVMIPNPRFTDNSNGTITDNLTGLIWLKNANCPNADRNWPTAIADVTSLNTNGTMNGNNCGDSSNGGTHRSDWRLPNIREIFSVVHFGFFDPALSNAAGTAKWNGTDAFTGLMSDPGLSTYWSSTANAFDPTAAWVVDFDGLSIIFSVAKTGGIGSFVLPVRGP